MRIQKFIRGIKPEIRLAVENKRPTTLRQAFQEAQRKDKEWREDEYLRRQQSKQNSFKETVKETDKREISEADNQHKKTYEPRGFEKKKYSQLKCNHCKNTGHTEEKCFRKNGNFRKLTSWEKAPPARKATESSDEEWDEKGPQDQED